MPRQYLMLFIVVVAIIGVFIWSFSAGYFGWIKDWNKVKKYGIIYLISVGAAVHLYWLYIFITNI